MGACAQSRTKLYLQDRPPPCPGGFGVAKDKTGKANLPITLLMCLVRALLQRGAEPNALWELRRAEPNTLWELRNQTQNRPAAVTTGRAVGVGVQEGLGEHWVICYGVKRKL